MVKTHTHISLALLIVALLLAACGAPTAQVPTVAPTSAPAAPTTAAAQPTPTFESVADVEPTIGAATAEPTIAPTEAAAAASGTLAWRDQVLNSDGVSISITGLAPPTSGTLYGAWLANKDQSVPLGPLTFDDSGKATLAFQAQDQQNLLGAFDTIAIVLAPQAEVSTNSRNVVLTGALPPLALVHIRHVLFSIGVTPNKLGFVLGLRQEGDEVLRHAQFLQDAYEANDFALERVHAEHIINIIRGSEARDGNGDGEIQNPGDGFGLLTNGQQDGYIKGMIDHAKLAADAADATAEIKLHAGHVQIVGENTRERVDQVRSLAEQVLAADGRDATQKPVQAILALAQQVIQGVDANGDEQIGPIPGEGGVLTAYQHAQLMAAISIGPAGDAEGLAPAAPVAAAPTDAAVPAAAPQTVNISVGDNTFDPKTLNVPVGTTVLWTNDGQRPHTVTADDKSFDSGNMDKSATFSFTFTKAGTFPYYCDYHGGPGGQGMAATIVVGDATSAAAPAAPAAATPAAEHSGDHGAAPTEASAAPAAPLVVSMQDFLFDAKEIRVKVGTTVSWKNDGAKPHSATAVDTSFDTGLYGAGESKTVTFNTPGTFAYFCQLHGSPDGTSGMVGTVIVEP